MTEEAKHTRGDWFWSGNTLMANRDLHSEFVCEVDGASVADKALIAAAPDLLAMLKVAQLWLDVDGRFDMRGINAAIAKATTT